MRSRTSCSRSLSGSSGCSDRARETSPAAISSAWNLRFFCLASPALGQADEQQPKNAAQITVYGWASGFDGRIQPGSNLPTLEVDRSFGELLRDSNGAFWVTGLVKRDRFVVIADLSHTSSSTEGSGSTGIPVLPVVEAEGGLKQTALGCRGIQALPKMTVSRSICSSALEFGGSGPDSPCPRLGFRGIQASPSWIPLWPAASTSLFLRAGPS